MRCEDIPVRGQNTRKEVKNREIEEQIETDEKKSISWESNSEQSIQETCGDSEVGKSQLNSQRFDRWTSFSCNHFHHLKMISIELRVGGTFVLSIDLIRTKRATVFSLKNEKKPTFNGEHSHPALCLCTNTWCARRLF